jgi:hypothetical protein
MYLTVIVLSWLSYKMMMRDPKIEILMTRTSTGTMIRCLHIACSAVLLLYGLRRYRRKVKLHVEKVIYNTADETFDFTRRKTWGSRYQ